MTEPQKQFTFELDKKYTLQQLTKQQLILDLEISNAALFKKQKEKYLFQTDETEYYTFKLQYTIPNTT